MINPTIETDYLVIGSGLTGLAFADTLITESEPPRVSRRLFGLSYAAMGMVSCIA